MGEPLGGWELSPQQGAALAASFWVAVKHLAPACKMATEEALALAHAQSAGKLGES